MLMKGKKGIIFGVSNKMGLAYGVAKALHDAGAEIAFTYAGEVMESRVKPIAEEMNSKLVISCDVSDESQIEASFKAYEQKYGQCDFVLHAVAFANREDLMGDFYKTTKSGWDLAMGVSAYSLIPMARHAKPLMTEGGSILALSYLGGAKVVPHYNIMGVAKAALECTVRYLAADLGSSGIRVNALSAGPVKTLAAKGISGFNILHRINEMRAPLKRNVSLEDVGKSGLYLLSDLSSGVTAETHYVDCGMNEVAISKEEALLFDSIKNPSS